jgi:hypothetical protein
MQIVVWYPAVEATARPVLLQDYVEMSAGRLGPDQVRPGSRRAVLDAFASDPLSNGVTQARVDSVLQTRMAGSLGARRAEGRFPLLVFLHATPWGASIMSEYLASHGFVVAAIESKGARTAAYRLSRENLDAMVADAAFVITRMRREPDVDDRLGIIGMSNGSIAALGLQLTGPLPRAVVSLDGGIGEGAGGTYLRERSAGDSTRLTVPLLHLYSPDNPHLDFRYVRSYVASERALVRVDHLRHGDFLAAGALERLMPGAFGPAKPEATLGFEVVARYAHSFLRAYVARDRSAANFLATIRDTTTLPAGFTAVEVLPAATARRR